MEQQTDLSQFRWQIPRGVLRKSSLVLNRNGLKPFVVRMLAHLDRAAADRIDEEHDALSSFFRKALAQTLFLCTNLCRSPSLASIVLMKCCPQGPCFPLELIRTKQLHKNANSKQ
jgi:hypothetical protein